MISRLLYSKAIFLPYSLFGDADWGQVVLDEAFFIGMFRTWIARINGFWAIFSPIRAILGIRVLIFDVQHLPDQCNFSGFCFTRIHRLKSVSNLIGSFTPVRFRDDKTRSKNILIHPKVSRRILHLMQLRRVRSGHRHNVQPELVIKVAGLLPLVGR